MSDAGDFKRFLTSSSAAFGVRFGAAAASFLLNVVATRTLGSHEAGLFFLAQTCLLILAMCPRIGLDNVLVRMIATSVDQDNSRAAGGVLAKALLVVLPLAVIVATSTYLNSERIATQLLNQSEFGPVLRRVAVCIIPFSIYQLVSFAIAGKHWFVWSATINAFFFPVLLLCAVGFSKTFGIDSAVSLLNVAVVVCGINAVFALAIWSFAGGLSVDWKAIAWKRLFSMSIPLFFITIVSYANTWSPQLVLAGYSDPHEIAVFSVSMKTAALITLLITPINSVASPTFAALYQRNQHQELRNFVHRVNGVVFLISVPILVALFAFASQCLTAFGPEFSNSQWVLRVLVIGQLANCLTGSVSFLLMMTGHERQLRNATSVAAVIGLVTAFALIPTLGALGAAIAGAVSLVTCNLIVWSIVRTKLGVNVFRPDLTLFSSRIRRVVKT